MERGKVSLRDYQIRAIEQLDKARRALFVLPTGGGKTVIAAGLIDQAVARDERVLVLTHRREILNQTPRALAALDHGVIQAGLALDLGPPVQVASVQTLHARAMRRNKIPLPPADLIIIDEAHHVRAQTWSGILDQYQKARIIGLTATPCRGDGRGLGDTFDELIEGPQVAELIEQGYLVKTRYFAPSTPSLKGVETRKGDYVINQLSRRMNTDALVGDVVTQWAKHAEGRKTIAFAVDVEHSIHIRDEFLNAGIAAEHIDGSTPKGERDAILDRLRSGETRVVANCLVLTEGFDCPDVGCIVLARPTKQLGLYRQMAGRGLRPATGKTDLIMLDHSGAVFAHGKLEDPIIWTLETDKRATNPAHESRDVLSKSRLLECSCCGAVRTAGEPCPECGFLPKRRGEGVVFHDEDLQEVGGKPIQISLEEKQRWYRELMALREQRNEWRASNGKEPLKPAWAAAKFKDKFGEWPPFAWNSLSPANKPSLEVSSWVRSRDIAFAKRMGKERAA
jgi:DNA repair protein RadD